MQTQNQKRTCLVSLGSKADNRFHLRLFSHFRAHKRPLRLLHSFFYLCKYKTSIRKNLQGECSEIGKTTLDFLPPERQYTITLLCGKF